MVRDHSNCQQNSRTLLSQTVSRTAELSFPMVQRSVTTQTASRTAELSFLKLSAEQQNSPFQWSSGPWPLKLPVEQQNSPFSNCQQNSRTLLSTGPAVRDHSNCQQNSPFHWSMGPLIVMRNLKPFLIWLYPWGPHPLVVHWVKGSDCWCEVINSHTLLSFTAGSLLLEDLWKLWASKAADSLAPGASERL